MTLATAIHETGSTILTKQSSIFVVDDDPEVRRSVSALARSVGLNARTYASAYDFMVDFDISMPGCLVIDVRMPGITGLELQNRLLNEGVVNPIIMISEECEIGVVTRAMRAGALDFLLKPLNSDTLLERINQGLNEDENRRRREAGRHQFRTRLERLTARERQVLDCFVTGSTSRKIASKLGISAKTVDNHRARIFEKMDCDNMVHLAGLMFRHENAL